MSKIDNNDIGLKLFTSRIGINLTIFRASGNFPVEKDVFIILHKGRIIRSGMSRSNFVGILNGQVALLFNDCMIFSTSSVEICTTMKLN